MLLHDYCYVKFVFFIVNFVAAKDIENVPSDMYMNWTEINNEIHSLYGDLPSYVICNGSTIYSPLESCKCDEECWKYGDCCIDAAEKAWNEGKIVPHQQWKCEKFPEYPEDEENMRCSEWYAENGRQLCREWHVTVRKLVKNTLVFMIGLCPESFADSFISTMCHRNITDSSEYWYMLDVPVMSKSTGKIYTNVYCALCNNDTNISETNLTIYSKINNPITLINTSKYIPREHYWLANVSDHSRNENTTEIHFSVPRFDSSTEFRECYQSVDDCIHVSEYDNDQKKCRLFTYFTSSKRCDVTYKNYFCKKCNNDTDVGGGCGGAYGRKLIPFSITSYSLLLDFNSLTSSLGKSRYGCKHGEIYDPLQEKCVLIYCSKDNVKKNNPCIQISNNSSIPRNAILDPNCHRVLHTNFTILSNESVSVHSVFDKIYEIGEYELFNDTAMYVCVPDEEFCPSEYSEIQKILTIICLPLSLISLAIFIVMIFVMRKYQKLPGKIILSLSIMLFLSQFLFIFIDVITNKIACYIFAAVLHFSFLSTFFWINILAGNLCRNLFHLNDNSNHLKTYCYYSLYAWLFPMALVSTALIVDNTSILPILRPNYGVCFCWFSNAIALLLFFALPLTVILVENIIIFIITARRIQKTKKAVNGMDVQRKRLPLFFYIKLTLIMGLTWVVGIVASFVDYEPLWIAFIILNGLQGMFIFISFTLKESVLQKYREYIFCKCTRTNSGDILYKDTVDLRVMYTNNACAVAVSQNEHKSIDRFGKPVTVITS